MITEIPQADEPVRPGVVTWFKVYCGILCCIYLGIASLSLILFRVPPEEMDMSAGEARGLGIAVLVAGLLFFAVCALPFFVEPRPWVWAYGLGLICLGMTSACFLPACVPMLIYWIKPEAKRYFGNS